MPQVPKVKSKYVVSFNGTYDAEYGDGYRRTADWEGNDVYGLAMDSITNTPDCPMRFKRNPDDDDCSIMGWFYTPDDPNDESPHAVMMTTEYFYG
jgi:hypothetical protein